MVLLMVSMVFGLFDYLILELSTMVGLTYLDTIVFWFSVRNFMASSIEVTLR